MVDRTPLCDLCERLESEVALERTGALRTLLLHVSSGSILKSALGKDRSFCTASLSWFNFPETPMAPEMLNLILDVVKTKQGRVTIDSIGGEEFFAAFVDHGHPSLRPLAKKIHDQLTSATAKDSNTTSSPGQLRPIHNVVLDLEEAADIETAWPIIMSLSVKLGSTLDVRTAFFQDPRLVTALCEVATVPSQDCLKLAHGSVYLLCTAIRDLTSAFRRFIRFDDLPPIAHSQPHENTVTALQFDSCMSQLSHNVMLHFGALLKACSGSSHPCTELYMLIRPWLLRPIRLGYCDVETRWESYVSMIAQHISIQSSKRALCESPEMVARLSLFLRILRDAVYSHMEFKRLPPILTGFLKSCCQDDILCAAVPEIEQLLRSVGGDKLTHMLDTTNDAQRKTLKLYEIARAFVARADWQFLHQTAVPALQTLCSLRGVLETEPFTEQLVRILCLLGTCDTQKACMSQSTDSNQCWFETEAVSTSFDDEWANLMSQVCHMNGRVVQVLIQELSAIFVRLALDSTASRKARNRSFRLVQRLVCQPHHFLTHLATISSLTENDNLQCAFARLAVSILKLPPSVFTSNCFRALPFVTQLLGQESSVLIQLPTFQSPWYSVNTTPLLSLLVLHESISLSSSAAGLLIRLMEMDCEDQELLHRIQQTHRRTSSMFETLSSKITRRVEGYNIKEIEKLLMSMQDAFFGVSTRTYGFVAVGDLLLSEEGKIDANSKNSVFDGCFELCRSGLLDCVKQATITQSVLPELRLLTQLVVVSRDKFRKWLHADTELLLGLWILTLRSSCVDNGTMALLCISLSVLDMNLWMPNEVKSHNGCVAATSLILRALQAEFDGLPSEAVPCTSQWKRSFPYPSIHHLLTPALPEKWLKVPKRNCDQIADTIGYSRTSQSTKGIQTIERFDLDLLVRELHEESAGEHIDQKRLSELLDKLTSLSNLSTRRLVNALLSPRLPKLLQRLGRRIDWKESRHIRVAKTFLKFMDCAFSQLTHVPLEWLGEGEGPVDLLSLCKSCLQDFIPTLLSIPQRHLEECFMLVPSIAHRVLETVHLKLQYSKDTISSTTTLLTAALDCLRTDSSTTFPSRSLVGIALNAVRLHIVSDVSYDSCEGAQLLGESLFNRLLDSVMTSVDVMLTNQPHECMTSIHISNTCELLCHLLRMDNKHMMEVLEQRVIIAETDQPFGSVSFASWALDLLKHGFEIGRVPEVASGVLRVLYTACTLSEKIAASLVPRLHVIAEAMHSMDRTVLPDVISLAASIAGWHCVASGLGQREDVLLESLTSVVAETNTVFLRLLISVTKLLINLPKVIALRPLESETLLISLWTLASANQQIKAHLEFRGHANLSNQRTTLEQSDFVRHETGQRLTVLTRLVVLARSNPNFQEFVSTISESVCEETASVLSKFLKEIRPESRQRKDEGHCKSTVEDFLTQALGFIHENFELCKQRCTANSLQSFPSVLVQLSMMVGKREIKLFDGAMCVLYDMASDEVSIIRQQCTKQKGVPSDKEHQSETENTDNSKIMMEKWEINVDLTTRLYNWNSVEWDRLFETVEADVSSLYEQCDRPDVESALDFLNQVVLFDSTAGIQFAKCVAKTVCKTIQRLLLSDASQTTLSTCTYLCGCLANVSARNTHTKELLVRAGVCDALVAIWPSLKLYPRLFHSVSAICNNLANSDSKIIPREFARIVKREQSVISLCIQSIISPDESLAMYHQQILCIVSAQLPNSNIQGALVKIRCVGSMIARWKTLAASNEWERLEPVLALATLLTTQAVLADSFARHPGALEVIVDTVQAGSDECVKEVLRLIYNLASLSKTSSFVIHNPELLAFVAANCCKSSIKHTPSLDFVSLSLATLIHLFRCEKPRHWLKDLNLRVQLMEAKDELNSIACCKNQQHPLAGDVMSTLRKFDCLLKMVVE